MGRIFQNQLNLLYDQEWLKRIYLSDIRLQTKYVLWQFFKKKIIVLMHGRNQSPTESATLEMPLLKLANFFTLLFPKLHRCRDDGRFQNKPWFDCRERNTCLKPPARPPTFTGLDFSESVGVREFDEAVYKCKPGFDVAKNVAVKRVR